jgi:RNA polymerase sigma factor (sigma-70 family)
MKEDPSMPVKLSRVVENDLVIIAKTRLDELDAGGACNQLLEEHESAIRGVAKKLCAALGRGDLLEDFMQEGRVALNQAINHFEPLSGWNPENQRDETARLWSYAYRRVMGAMWNYFGKLESVGIRGLGHQLNLARKALQVHDNLLKAKGEKPTPAAIAKELNLSIQAVEQALGLIGLGVVSLDDLLTPDESKAPAIQLRSIEPPPDDQAEWKERLGELQGALKHLRDPRYGGKYERHYKVFILRYFGELKIDEIAEGLNIPPGTVKNDLYRFEVKLWNLLTHLPEELLGRYHAQFAYAITPEERQHVETHLKELSPDHPYCGSCKSLSDLFALVTPLYFQGVETNEIIAKLRLPSSALENALTRLRRAYPHLNSEELSGYEGGNVEARARSKIDIHLRYCCYCLRRVKLSRFPALLLIFALLLPLLLQAA